ncbi:hypothetical protein FPV67DRAFT_1723959 [Lyophyllum atratum]|nr:hypothetical protein FPV67DRAFT_1723959 [Lyophyllum atratum]
MSPSSAPQRKPAYDPARQWGLKVKLVAGGSVTYYVFAVPVCNGKHWQEGAGESGTEAVKERFEQGAPELAGKGYGGDECAYEGEVAKHGSGDRKGEKDAKGKGKEKGKVHPLFPWFNQQHGALLPFQRDGKRRGLGRQIPAGRSAVFTLYARRLWIPNEIEINTTIYNTTIVTRCRSCDRRIRLHPWELEVVQVEDRMPPKMLKRRIHKEAEARRETAVYIPASTLAPPSDHDTASSSTSWATVYDAIPPIKYPYDPKKALGDLPGRKERLSFTTGYGLIQRVNGLMSYADEDLLAGVGHTRHGNLIASQHRKKVGFFGSILGSTSSHSRFIKHDGRGAPRGTLFAESLFEKALLGIVYSGDWLASIKEALNMRTTIGIYRQLGAFLDDADAAYAASIQSTSFPPSSAASTATSFSITTPTTATTTTTSDSSLPTSTRPTTPASTIPPTTPTTPTSKPRTKTKTKKTPQDPTIDPHFRSSVYLGVGMCNIILSLMPTELATLVELFEYKGARAHQ